MTSNNALMAQMGIVGVVVMKESNMAPYFPKVGNLNGSCTDMHSVAGPLSSSSGNLFALSDRSNKTLDPVLLPFPSLLAQWPPSWI